MADVLGFDIGGANTKASLISVEKGKLLNVKLIVEYFPVWQEPKNLKDVLMRLGNQLSSIKPNAIGVTMTAELSDSFQTKREGVYYILGCVRKAFPIIPIYVLNSDAKLESMDAANQEPLKVAGANWAATGWLVARYIKNCVVVDVGSTSTSIIPILNGKIVARGKTDLDKLIYGELVYTGSLRTNVTAIVQSVPVRGNVAAIASELFAISGDVHIILGNIDEKKYSVETTDGRGKKISDALVRLARIVCADIEMLKEQEIIQMAQYVYERQIQQIAVGINKTYAYLKSLASSTIPVVVTGLGKDFLARKAAETLGVDEIIDFGTLILNEGVLASPAFGVALMVADELEGEPRI